MTENKAVVLERTYEVAPSVIWQMWTEADHFAQWYGPDGATVAVKKMDVTPGGARLIQMKMQTPNGPMEMHFAGEHLEVVANQKLVYTEAMSDKDGNTLPSPDGAPTPAATLVTVELSEIDGGTALTLTHAGIPADSPGAAGWNMALAKLATVIGGR